MAFDFDRIDDWGDLAAPVTAAPLTLAAWFNLDDTTQNHRVLALEDIGVGQNEFTLSARGDAAGNDVRATTEAAGVQSSANALTGYSANTWTHGASIFASSTSRFAAKDGVFGVESTTSRTPTGIDSVRLAAVADGRVAEAAIWNVALTEAEVAALAKGYSPLFIRRSALVFYWQGIRSALINLRGAPLTISGAPVVADHPRIIYPRSYRNISYAATEIEIPARILQPIGSTF